MNVIGNDQKKLRNTIYTLLQILITWLRCGHIIVMLKINILSDCWTLDNFKKHVCMVLVLADHNRYWQCWGTKRGLETPAKFKEWTFSALERKFIWYLLNPINLMFNIELFTITCRIRGSGIFRYRPLKDSLGLIYS